MSTLPVVADIIRKDRLSRGDPDRVAVAFGDERVTYAELDARTDRLAAGLVAEGLGKGERVGILSHNRIEYVEAFFAIAKAGAVVVPVNYLLRPVEVGDQLDDADANWLIAEDRFLDVARDVAASRDLRLVTCGAPADDLLSLERLRDADGPPLEVEVDGEDLVLLQYTSGTTGRSKGAAHRQAGVVFNLLGQVVDIDLREDDVYLCVPALCWAAGLHSICLPVMYRGGTIVLNPSGGFDPDALCELAERERATVMVGVPVVMRALLDTGALERHDLSAVRVFVTGAEPVPVELLDRFHETLPGVEIVQGYGQSEFPTIMAVLDGRHAREKAGSTGKATALVRLRVVDEDGRDVPAGEHGEILCSSPASMTGYWRQPEETAKTIVDGWLRTGDRGWVDEDGFLYIAGRSKEMIISGGLNVYPAEIERVLHEHDAVAEVAVVGVPDDALGEVGWAHVVLTGDAPPSADELTAWCRERLAGFKVPRKWTLREEPLPRTASGKVQKFKLADPVKETS